MKAACDKWTWPVVASVGFALALILLIGSAIDAKRVDAIFESPPGEGYSGILVDLRDGSKQDAHAIVERLMGLEGAVYEIPSITYSIGSDRARVRANRKTADLSSSKVDDFEAWMREREIGGDWFVVIFQNDRAIRSFGSGYDASGKP